MKYFFRNFFIALVFLIPCVLDAQTSSPPTAGDGTLGTPYEISSLNNLYWLSQNSGEWSKHYIQTSNIDATTTSGWNTGEGFTPIGNGTTKFTGTYDGQNFSIGHLTINRGSSNEQALFGYAQNALFNNIELTDVDIKGSYHSGGLVGRAISSNTDNCSVSGSLELYRYGGGLIGKNTLGTISNCSSSVNILGWRSIGGIVGFNERVEAVISDCYSNANVDYIDTKYGGAIFGGIVGHTQSDVLRCCADVNIIAESYVGGIVGWGNLSNNSAGDILECSASGTIVSDNATGGVVGVYGSNVSSKHLENCYSSVDISITSGGFENGGIAGFIRDVVQNNYFSGTISGSATSRGGVIGRNYNGQALNNIFNSDNNPGVPAIGSGSCSNCNGKTTAQMQAQATYQSGGYNWNFSSIWNIDEGASYPSLQNSSCQNSSPPVLYAEALDFDGTNDYVSVPNSGTLNFGTGDFTLEAWFKKSNSASTRIISKFQNGGNGYQIAASSTLIFQLRTNGVSALAISSTPIDDNQWHHVACVREGDNLLLYLDGALDVTATGAVSQSPNNSQPLQIGRFIQNLLYYAGQLDEVRIWNKALCEVEVQGQMNCELSGSESGLVSYYQFNEGISDANNAGTTTLPDVSGNGNNGVLSNFALDGSSSNWVAPGGVVAGSSCGTTLSCCPDADGDGYFDAACGGDDCDDSNASINPGATEICDGIDNNCDGQTDEGLTSTFYADADGDGFGDANDTVQSCSAPAGYVTDSSDCNDNDDNVYPGNTEICDGKDNNCDGQIDEGVTSTFYADADGDGFGDANDTVQDCSVPTGYVTDDSDCDDSDGNNFPGNIEICDGKDNNCDGQIDEGVTSTFYADVDGDGFGDVSNTVQDCSVPAGYVTNDSDCDDSDGNNFPGNIEVCDGKDNNCDGIVDENFADSDNDGIADCVDPDDDNDGVADIDDNCPFDVNAGQEDLDLDGLGDACDATVNVCSAIVGLIDYVESLNLPNNTEGFLINKLNKASDKFQSGNNNAAIGNLNAFINKVNAKTPSQISESEADYLIGIANAITDAINNGNTDCSDNQNLIIPNNPVTVEASIEVIKLKLFPNPANNKLNIQLYGMEGIINLTIYNQFGSIVWSQKLEEGQRVISINLSSSQLTNGIYHVRATSEGQEVTQRFVITK